MKKMLFCKIHHKRLNEMSFKNIVTGKYEICAMNQEPNEAVFKGLSRDTEVAISSKILRVDAYVSSDDRGKTFYLRTDKYDESFDSIHELMSYLKKYKFEIIGYDKKR